MKLMKDKDKLAPMLRAFKLGHIDFDYAMNYILKVYSDSKRFNWNSFSWGISVGLLVYLIIQHFIKE